ncbi:serine palmitoyltransferase 1 [Orussus abietinus]|uniref:serine palmitoyltransferase 1 n=1 Tax=Orussus abietinus TaxID=222816 RepID=UPI000625AFA8|nr:serine palmitoyltransferase 1 [Orussus abietinus]
MTSKLLFFEPMGILNTIPQYHALLGVFLILWMLVLITKRWNARECVSFTEDEVRRKLAEWEPEPLISEVPKDHPSLHPRLVTSRVGKKITVNNSDCLNLGTHNYLDFIDNKEIEKRAIETIEKYGVGSCGPRGFYGTVDVHLELEERLAKFMEAEEAVLYSYGFSTIASAIPAYCKRRDLVFVDEKVNFAVQKGLDASRSVIQYFKHNDVRHLESLLQNQVKKDEKNPKAGKIRRFLIVEGIYMNTGTICPLPELVALCRKYKLRIFVDESISFGTLGKHGRGVTEFYGVPRQEIDLIMGSLDWAMGSIGGFCVGSSFIIDHQRLAGLGYCFSASLPPLLTAAAITSLDTLEKKPEILERLERNCLALHAGLKRIKYFDVPSLAQSPLKHLYLIAQLEHDEEQLLLEQVSRKCIENNLAIITPAYLAVERELPRSSIRICVSVALDDNDISFALNTLERCAIEVLSDKIHLR